MNLATDPWIPVLRMDRKPDTVSLCQAFEQGHQLQDLAVRPHERIALMRLLICVAQAALDGPADCDDWKLCPPRIAPAALDYLKRWRHAFELFGDGQRFLQVPNLKKPSSKARPDDEQENSASKLDLTLATGNNPTLFDNAGSSQRAFKPAELALPLLTFQCFSPGGRIGVALWHGHETPGGGSSDHAPCLTGRMLHALLRGESLLDTLHRNLMTKRQAGQFFGAGRWGKPVWESMPQRLADAAAASNATRTYLGRLLPLSRAIRLADDCRSLVLANGLDYPPYSESGWREPSATLVVRQVKGEQKRVLLQLSLGRSIWRELHALTVKGITASGLGGPPALQNVSDEKPFDLWVGALLADQAKLVDAIESVFHIPAAMLTETSQQLYEHGVRHAERAAWRLERAVTKYHNELGDNLDPPQMKNRRQQIRTNASASFWTDTENAVPRLLEVAAAPEDLGLKVEWHKTVWGQSVWRAACAAYERACPHETPRQIRAYALGLRTLLTTPAEHGKPETEQEAES